MVDTYNISRGAKVLITADEDVRRLVTVHGDSVYYGSETVSAANSSVANGDSVTLDRAKYFLSAGSSQLIVETIDPFEGFDTTDLDPLAEDSTGGMYMYPNATYLKETLSTYTGQIASDGTVLAVEINHGTHERKTVEVGTATQDDHNRCALFVHPDWRTVAVWNNHNLNGVQHIKVGGFGTIEGLAEATDQSNTNIRQVTYAQLHLIEGLSTPGVEAVFLLFDRRRNPPNWQWQLRLVTVDQETGDVVVNTGIVLLDFGIQQGYISSAPSYDNDETIRIAIGQNPSQTDHDFRYIEMDPQTGAVTDEDGVSLGFTGYGSEAVSGMPIDVFADIPVAVEAPSGGTSLLMRVRPGPAPPAIAMTHWTSSGVGSYVHAERDGAGWTEADLGDPGAEYGNFGAKHIGHFNYPDPCPDPGLLYRAHEADGTSYLTRMWRREQGAAWVEKILRQSSGYSYLGGPGAYIKDPEPPKNGGPLACTVNEVFSYSFDDYDEWTASLVGVST